MRDIQTVCTKRLRNIADNLSANGYIDSAFEVKHAADVIDELKALVLDMWDAALHPQLFGDGSHLLERMDDLGVEVDE